MGSASSKCSGDSVPDNFQTTQSSPAEGYEVNLTSRALHDLVGPMNQVCLLSSLMVGKYRGRLDDQADVLLNFMEDSARRLGVLLGGLEAYARALRSAGPRSRCDANDLLAGALGPIQGAIDQSGASLTHDFLPEVFCDPRRMCLVFGNLIDNSIKFRREVRPEIHVSAVSKDDAWLFSVHDNGIGIAPRHHERIFGVFERVHRDVYPGAGVGLAIAQRIIERHGGKIWVESELGRGATFFFTLSQQTFSISNAIA